MKLDIHYLQSFYHLGLIQNYTKTAKKLHLTQSAISHSIKKLELSIGVNLIKKHNNKFELTEYGELLFNVCENIFTQIDNVEEIINHKAHFKEISIIIGAPVEFGCTFLINCMQPFLSENQNYHINYKFHHSVFDKLIKNEIDFAIDDTSHFHESIETIFLCDEQYAVISSPKYANENSLLSIKDFHKAKILSIDSKGIWWGKFLSSALEKEPISLRKVIHINHIRGLINGVLSGMGIGLVPRYTIKNELKQGILVEIFTDIEIRKDIFNIYIKKEKLKLDKNLKLIQYLKDKLQNR